MTNKPAQLLIIEPANELKFIGPFCTAVSSYMRLTNPTEHTIMFKIKTTAPKKYCVRPNWGVLDSKDTIEIAIILQPFNFDANEKNKHKFMVQSMIMPEGREENPEQLWKDVSPDDLMDSKLRCVFEMPADSNQTTAATNTVTTTAMSQQLANATPNKNESGVSAMESQHGISASNEDDSILMAELKKLREVESSLRNENLMLKENMLKMRLDLETSAKEHAKTLGSSPGSIGGGSMSAAAASAAQYQNPYSPPALANPQQIPIVYVIAAIVMAIFGLILGKFVL